MQWYWWVLIVLAGGIIAFQVFRYFVAAAVPIETAGRLYLSAELKNHGIRHLIPYQCVIEIADRMSKTAEVMANIEKKSRMSANADMVDSIDSQVGLIVGWIHCDPSISRFMDFSNMLERYKIPFGIEKKTR